MAVPGAAPPSMTSMLRMLAPMAVIQLTKNIKFDEDEDAMLKLRVGFVVAQVAAMLLCWFILARIDSVKEQRTITVDGNKETIHMHDRRHLLQSLKPAVISMLVVFAIHMKWGYTNPLLLTGAQALLNFVDGPQQKLLMAYVFGRSVERPLSTAPQVPAWLEQKKDELEQKKAVKATPAATSGPAKKSKKAD